MLVPFYFVFFHSPARPLLRRTERSGALRSNGSHIRRAQLLIGHDRYMLF